MTRLAEHGKRGQGCQARDFQTKTAGYNRIDGLLTQCAHIIVLMSSIAQNAQCPPQEQQQTQQPEQNQIEGDRKKQLLVNRH